MTDAKSFICALCESDDDQVKPLLRACNREQWLGLKDIAQRILTHRIPLNGKLPKKSKRWLHNFAFKHNTPGRLKRSVTQRGGSQAALAGQVIKVLAKSAAPHLKTVGKAILTDVISSGVKGLANRFRRKPAPINENSDEETDRLLTESSAIINQKGGVRYLKEEEEDISNVPANDYERRYNESDPYLDVAEYDF
jgi:hypothetical protein